MKIDFLSVFDDLKKEDIMYGGKENFAIQKNMKPYINQKNRNHVNAYKYLLVQFEFYIFHVCHCRDLLSKGATEEEIKYMGYSLPEIDSAKKMLKQYGQGFESRAYLYMATAKMGVVASVIEKIQDKKPIQGVPKEIIESAQRRIDFANGKIVDTKIFEEMSAYET